MNANDLIKTSQKIPARPLRSVVKWPFLYREQGIIKVEQIVQTGVQVCRPAPDKPDKMFPITRSEIFAIGESPQQTDLHDVFAAWRTESGLRGIYSTYIDPTWCAETVAARVEMPSGNKVAKRVNALVPFEGGYVYTTTNMPNVLNVSYDHGRIIVLKLAGTVRMLMPLYDDLGLVVVDIMERNMVDPRRKPPILGPGSFSQIAYKSFLLRPSELTWLRVLTEFPDQDHISILMREGLVAVTHNSGEKTEHGYPGRKTSIVKKYTLVDDSPVITERHNVSHRDLYAKAGAHVHPSPVTSARTRKHAEMPPDLYENQEEAALIRSFLKDPDFQCSFPGCERMLKAYRDEIEAAGGEDCPLCERTPIESKYTHLIKLALRSKTPA